MSGTGSVLGEDGNYLAAWKVSSNTMRRMRIMAQPDDELADGR
jgi:hypothetical protein